MSKKSRTEEYNRHIKLNLFSLMCLTMIGNMLY